MERILCITLCLCLTFLGAPAWAGERLAERVSRFDGSPAEASRGQWAQAVEDQTLGDPAEMPSPADEELEERLRALRIRRDEVNVHTPRRAMLAGGILLGVGVLVGALAGVTCAAANSGSGTECREDRATGIAVGGGVVAGVGLVTLISGLSTSTARKKEVEEYDRKIKALNKQRRPTVLPVDARLSLGEEKKLTLSWRF